MGSDETQDGSDDVLTRAAADPVDGFDSARAASLFYITKYAAKGKLNKKDTFANHALAAADRQSKILWGPLERSNDYGPHSDSTPLSVQLHAALMPRALVLRCRTAQ